MIDLNTILVISLGVLAFVSLILVMILVPVALQLSRTLSSIQSFMDVVNDDVRPAVKEVKKSIYGVKSIFQKTTNILDSATSEARTMILASAHGFVSGVKQYLTICKSSENGYNNNGKVKESAVQ